MIAGNYFSGQELSAEKGESDTQSIPIDNSVEHSAKKGGRGERWRKREANCLP